VSTCDSAGGRTPAQLGVPDSACDGPGSRRSRERGHPRAFGVPLARTLRTRRARVNDWTRLSRGRAVAGQITPASQRRPAKRLPLSSSAQGSASKDPSRVRIARKRLPNGTLKPSYEPKANTKTVRSVCCVELRGGRSSIRESKRQSPGSCRSCWAPAARLQSSFRLGGGESARLSSSTAA
jgi:hypothetical protein